MFRTGVLTELQRQLDWLKIKSERKYGHAVWDVRCRAGLQESHILVTGYVLLQEQKSALLRAAAGLLKGAVGLDCEVEVLAETFPAKGSCAGKAKADLLNVYSRPLERFLLRADSERFLSTQTTPCDHTLRILLEHRGWLLVQLIDGTLGWAEKQLIDVSGEFVEQPAAAPGRMSGGKSSAESSDSFQAVAMAREYLGVRYLSGGVTKLGIDCSGFVQSVYKEALGVLLPKHSRDQISRGRPVPFKSRRPGDLVFFRAINGYDLHVGLVCEGHKVIHASRRKACVRIDEISTLASTLNLINLRRIETT